MQPDRSPSPARTAPGPILPLLPLLLLVMAGITSPGMAQVRAQSARGVADTLSPPPFQDTLYVLDSLFIEVNIAAQELYVHRSGNRIDTFLCSTGNPDLPKGLATRPGIFALRGKMPRHRSSRFDVTMLYWMPFDGGIGLHALEGNAYYNTLGDAPSSHGCVRLSRETAEDLYNHLPVGTRVLVHRGLPARVLALAERTSADLRIITARDAKLLRRRLDAVVNGRRDDPALKVKLALPMRGKGPAPIDVGRLVVGTVY